MNARVHRKVRRQNLEAKFTERALSDKCGLMGPPDQGRGLPTTSTQSPGPSSRRPAWMDDSQRAKWEPRFWAKVDKHDDDCDCCQGCWHWTAAKDYGYGVYTMPKPGSEKTRSHRVTYMLFVGLIPDGLVLDHLCRNPGCVNPAHLEAVTQRENVMRSEGLTAIHARKTHCDSGHEFTPENTYSPPSKPGTRACRQCHRERNREWMRTYYKTDKYRAKRKRRPAWLDDPEALREAAAEKVALLHEGYEAIDHHNEMVRLGFAEVCE